MIFTESRLTEEYHIKDNLYGYIRIYHTPDNVKVSMSLYEKYVECDELLIYNKTLQGKCPTKALAEAYRILSDEYCCEKLWKECKDLKKGKDE
jgi:hypothetical protein